MIVMIIPFFSSSSQSRKGPDPNRVFFLPLRDPNISLSHNSCMENLKHSCSLNCLQCNIHRFCDWQVGDAIRDIDCDIVGTQYKLAFLFWVKNPNTDIPFCLFKLSPFISTNLFSVPSNVLP